MHMLTLGDFLDSPTTGFTVRTPRRRGGYAAQVWGDTGFWLVGRFATTWKAREAALAFIAADPVEPAEGTPRDELPANWYWRRQWVVDPAEARRYVRRVKGGAWQARFWLGRAGGSLNLGIVSRIKHGDDAEWCAAQISKAFAREWRPGRTVGEVVELLKNSPRLSERVPAHVEVPARQRDLTPQTARGAGVRGGHLLRPARAERRLVTLAAWLAAA
jgi:hypothetical protein